MKISTLFISCLFMVAVAGCTAEISDPQQPDTDTSPVEVPAGEYELSASIGLMTKTELDDLVLNWEDDDVIKVWTGETFTDYTYQGEGKFAGEKPAVLKEGKYLALYPAASLSGTKAAFDIPAEQTFAVRKANDLPMVAVWREGENCVFHPVCSILEMPLTIPEGIVLKSIGYMFNGAVGAGSYTYDYESGAYEKAAAGDITLTGTFSSGHVYNAVIPGDYSDGFTLTLADTDGCAMVLTATNGSELAAGKVQPLGNVIYSQLAPEFTVSYDGWAATATLVSTQETGEQKYWLSKTINGEPLDGVEPVDMTGLKTGTAVKLYGYLCSENVSAAGVSDGDRLYFVSQHAEGNVAYLRSVEYTYHPDPLEVVIYGDDFHTFVNKNASNSTIRNQSCAYKEDIYAGQNSILITLPASGSARINLWYSGDYPDFDAQEYEHYHLELYFKMHEESVSDKTIRLRTVFVDKNSTSQNQARHWAQNALSTYTGGINPIPADTWVKVSIPMNQFWRLSSSDPGGNVKPSADYYGHNDDGTVASWNINFKDVSYFDILNIAGKEISFLIDHFTIRKSTL